MSDKIKLYILYIISILVSLMSVSEINYVSAINVASEHATTDGEIQVIMNHYGFEGDVFNEITPFDKIEAAFNRIF